MGRTLDVFTEDRLPQEEDEWLQMHEEERRGGQRRGGHDKRI